MKSARSPKESSKQAKSNQFLVRFVLQVCFGIQEFATSKGFFIFNPMTKAIVDRNLEPKASHGAKTKIPQDQNSSPGKKRLTCDLCHLYTYILIYLFNYMTFFVCHVKFISMFVCMCAGPFLDQCDMPESIPAQ